MLRTSMFRRGLTTTMCLAACALLVAAISGCGSGTGSGSGYGMKKPAASTPAASKATTGGMMAMSASASGTSDPSVQVCGECSGKGKGKDVAGAAVVKDGVQVVSIAIQAGYYVPNQISVNSAMPVKIVFTGKAKGCIAKPKFKSLGKSADLTGTGTATLMLGTLTPGTYGFTCAMGMGNGKIIVK